jgi:hypothetical protein
MAFLLIVWESFRKTITVDFTEERVILSELLSRVRIKNPITNTPRLLQSGIEPSVPFTSLISHFPAFLHIPFFSAPIFLQPWLARFPKKLLACDVAVLFTFQSTQPLQH